MSAGSKKAEHRLTIQLSSLAKLSLASKRSHNGPGVPKEYAMQCMMVVLLTRECICPSRVPWAYCLTHVHL